MVSSFLWRGQCLGRCYPRMRAPWNGMHCRRLSSHVLRSSGCRAQVYEVVAPLQGRVPSEDLKQSVGRESLGKVKALRRCISPPLLNAFESLAEGQCGSWVLVPVPQRGLVLCNGVGASLPWKERVRADYSTRDKQTSEYFC